MTIQNNALPTPRKPLDLRRFLDDWVMLLAAVAIFVACTLLIDNFLSPLNMRGLGLAISTTGIAVIVVSSDLMEVMGISDRILVLCEGALRGELSRDEANESNLLQLALPRQRADGVAN